MQNMTAPDADHFRMYRGHKGSAVSWGAVIAGAFVAAAVTVILVLLGSGVGFASISPWQDTGASAKTMTVAAAIWFIVVQWISSGFGGYIAGRLRTKWHRVHSHEIFFRDTAHGLLTWSVATVVGIGVLSSALATMAGAGMQTGAAVAGASAGSASAMKDTGGSMSSASYFVDSLYRTDHPAANATDQDVRNETLRLLAVDLKEDAVPDADKAYLAQLVSTRTGLSQPDAMQRVNTVLAQAEDAKAKALQAADTARKAAARFSLLAFMSMLIGAFIASAAAALGGHDRDHLYPEPDHEMG